MKLIILLSTLVLTTSVLSASGSCKKCEALRDYHANHPSEFVYYEDYLKHLEEIGGKLPEDPDFPKEYFSISDSEEEEDSEEEAG